jgi:CubicO group peptidase (beta-lactamase class C family)
MKQIVVSFSMIILLGMQSHAQLTIDTAARLESNPGIYSLLVSQNDHLVYARYFKDNNTNTLFSDQSLTKSICSLLIGIAIDKGYLTSVDEKLVTIFPELKDDSDRRKSEITIRQVMNQASGLYHEDLKSMFGLYNFLKLPDPSGYVLKAPLVGEPGKEWLYNNAATHLLSVILTRVTKMDTRAFAIKYLFAPLNITELGWAKMQDGYYDGSGLKSISLRSADLLKIASLLLHGGQYDHRQIVPEKWVKLIFNPDVIYHADWGFENSTYALCYYHTTYKGTKITYGMGWGGQFVILIPSLKAVIVANEDTADANAIRQSITFIQRIFPSIFNQLSKPDQ